MAKTKPTGFRFTAETVDQLDFLCAATGHTRSSLLASMIAAEYDRYQGNPELRKIIAQMTECQKQIRDYLGQE